MLNQSDQTKVNPIERRAGRRWYPWLISIGAHVAVLGGLSTAVFISFTGQADRPEIVPEARLGRIDPQLPLFHHEKQAPPLLPEKVLEKQLARHATEAIDRARSKQDQLDLIAMRPGRADDGLGGALGQSVPVVLPKTRLFNAYGNAMRVVYVVDVSPSMLPLLDPLKRELKRCLAELRPMQKFHVIFFSGGEPIEGPAKGLTWASDRWKRRYYKFIEQVETDIKTDPRRSVKRALELVPDLIYLLSDGGFDADIADQITKWAKASKIKINTLAYAWERGGGVLRQIAEQTGGIYRYVSEDQLEW